MTENTVSPYFNRWKKEKLTDIDQEFKEREKEEMELDGKGMNDRLI